MPLLKTFRRAIGPALFVFLLGQTAAATAVDLTQDDISFRKEVYVNKKGARMPYRLFVPLGYDSSKNYPLLLWLHGGTGRGEDNVKQITRQNELGTHFWIKSDVQAQFPVFVLVPQCPSSDIWADPEINQPSKALEMALEILGKVESEFAIDPDLWPRLPPPPGRKPHACPKSPPHPRMFRKIRPNFLRISLKFKNL